MHTVLVRKSEGKKPLRTLWCRWLNDIKVYLKEDFILMKIGI
jgi:hypothetical protein